MTEITTRYTLDMGDTFDKLDRLGSRMGDIGQVAEKSRGTNPFADYNAKASAFNQTLLQQTKTIQLNQARLNSMSAEIKSIQGEYAGLVKRQQEFVAAGRYKELEDKLRAVEKRLAEINKQMGQSSDGVTKVSKGSSDLGLVWNNIKNAAIGAFAVDRIIDVGTAIVETTAKFEKYEAVLTNALGSRSGAQEGLRMLAEYAAQTPYSVDELTGSFIKFVNRGLNPTKEQLTNIGDLAASQGKSFDQLTEAILDAQSGEFERLKEFGVRASKSGDQVTLSFKGVEKTVKATNGAITDAILSFGKLNGVAGSIASISQTLEGTLSNFGDQVDRTKVAIGNSGLSNAMKQLVTVAGDLLGVFTDLISVSPADSLRQQQAELNGLVGALVMANDNEAVRLNLIQQISQKYPEFLGQLDAESVSNDILAQRLAAVNAQYEKKIRLALGQKRITKVQDQLTASIRQQAEAFQILARESGKSIVELEKMTPGDRLKLAREVAARQPQLQGVQGGGGVMLSTDPRARLDQTLESAQQRQTALQKELNGLLGEQAQRQADLTKTTVEAYQKDIAQIKEKIRLKQIDKKLGEEEIKRLEGQIRQAQGLAPKLNDTPIGTGGKKKGKSDAEKTAEEEKAALLKVSEDYLKEYQSLEERYGKARLDALQKDSAEYIQEKAKQDEDEIKLARDKYEQLLQLARSNKTAVVDNKRVVVPDTSLKLEEMDKEAAEKFAFLLKQVRTKSNEELQRLEIDNRIKMLGLERKYNELELAEAEKKWDELIRLETDASKKQQLIRLKQKEMERISLGQAIDQLRGQETAQIAFYGQQRFEDQLRADNPNDSYLEIERKRQEAILNFRIDSGQKLIQLLEDQGKAENAVLISQTQEVVDGLRKQLGDLKLTPIATNIWDAIIPFKNKEQADAFKESMKTIGDAIMSTTQALIDQSNQRIQSLDNEISAKEKQVDEETQRQKEGAANNLAIRRAELDDLKRQKAEEEAVRRKATQVQQALDLASMISSQALVAQKSIETVVNSMNEQSKLGPIVGVIAAIAAAATIIGTIVSARAKIKAMTKMRTGGRLRGPSHEQGGIRGTGYFDDIEVEGDEYIVNRRSTSKHGELIEQINADNDAGIAKAAARYVDRSPIPQREFPQSVIQQLQNNLQVQAQSKADIGRLEQHLVTLANSQADTNKRLEAIERNTSKRVVGMADGRIYIEEGNKTTIKKP